MIITDQYIQDLRNWKIERGALTDADIQWILYKCDDKVIKSKFQAKERKEMKSAADVKRIYGNAFDNKDIYGNYYKEIPMMDSLSDTKYDPKIAARLKTLLKQDELNTIRGGNRKRNTSLILRLQGLPSRQNSIRELQSRGGEKRIKEIFESRKKESRSKVTSN